VASHIIKQLVRLAPGSYGTQTHLEINNLASAALELRMIMPFDAQRLSQEVCHERTYYVIRSPAKHRN
jgi:hypothetical protein